MASNLKIIYISEAINSPFDEGIKNYVFSLYKELQKKIGVVGITKLENQVDNMEIYRVRLNKFFLNKDLKSIITNNYPDAILYVPASSATFNSLLRAKILKLYCRKAKVAVLAVQHREYSLLFKELITYLRPDMLFLLSSRDQNFFQNKEFNVEIINPAISLDKFHKIPIDRKRELRNKYNIPKNRIVVLHVGHIKTKRNLDCFTQIQKIPGYQVILVGSTTTKQDNILKANLIKNGIIVIDKYVAEIEEIYQLSDIYVFSVVKSDAAIDMPLSVLEAMACNLMVITTKFGGLVDYFKEDSSFKYYEHSDELFEKIKNIKLHDIKNDKKVAYFSWAKLADNVIDILNNE